MYLFIFWRLNTLLAIAMLYFGVGIYVNYIGGPLDEYGFNVVLDHFQLEKCWFFQSTNRWRCAAHCDANLVLLV